MTIEPNEVSRIAWAIGEKHKLPNTSILAIANALWALIYPEKEQWTSCPHKPKD